MSTSNSRMSIRASTGESGLRVLPDLFKNRVVQLAEETVDSLQTIWSEAGYEEVECQSLLGDLLNKLKQTCASELAAEQQILEHAKQQVTAKLFEYTDYCAQLGRPVPEEGVPKGANYTDKLAELERLLSTISGEVSQRQKLLNTEMEAIAGLVTALGEEQPSEDIFKGPDNTPHLSDVRLELMRSHKAVLESAKRDRVKDVLEVAKECVQNMQDLVITEESASSFGDSDSEKSKGCHESLLQYAQDNNVMNLSLTKENLTLLQERCVALVDEKERRREELASSGAEIARLWTLLRIPQEEREAFQNSFQMNLSLETLAKGKKELERLYIVRTESLGRVVTSIREDILTLWDESGIESDEQRMTEFPEYFTAVDNLKDSTVDVHEAYYNSLRARVEELRPLLQEITRRENIAQERVELEHIQMNPERLSARGPKAREDRKREEAMGNRVKNLEKITKKLLLSIEKWEVTNGPFYFAGERYADRVEQQDENWQSIRMSLRNSRKKGKDDKNASGPSANMPKPIKRVSTAPSGATSSSSGYGYGQAKSSGYGQPPPQTPQGVALAPHVQNTKENVRGSSINANHNNNPLLNESISMASMSGLEKLPVSDRTSTGSDNTDYTSVTEIRQTERASTATLVRGGIN